MNDNDLRNNSNENNVYRATKNLNTALENPQVNINSATGVNIQAADDVNGDIPNYNVNQDFNNQNVELNSVSNVMLEDNQNSQVVNSSQFIPNLDNNGINNNVEVTNQVVTGSDVLNADDVSNDINDSSNMDGIDVNARYEPTMKQKKKPNSGSIISKEIKAMMVIVLLLMLVVYVIPYVYDFFSELDLVITNG